MCYVLPFSKPMKSIVLIPWHKPLLKHLGSFYNGRSCALMKIINIHDMKANNYSKFNLYDSIYSLCTYFIALISFKKVSDVNHSLKKGQNRKKSFIENEP